MFKKISKTVALDLTGPLSQLMPLGLVYRDYLLFLFLAFDEDHLGIL